MLPDPELVSECRGWFTKASFDLKAGDADLIAGAVLAGDASFHAQQAAEKAVKGFLTWHSLPFRKTHDLVELGESAAAVNPTLEPILRRAAPLTQYAWKFRYPGEESEDMDPLLARESLAVAREVYEAILILLPREVRPALVP